MFEVKNSIVQMTSENNDLEFDRFKTTLDEAIQEHSRIKSGMLEQTKHLS